MSLHDYQGRLNFNTTRREIVIFRVLFAIVLELHAGTDGTKINPLCAPIIECICTFLVSA